MRRLFTLLLSLTATATLCLAQDDGQTPPVTEVTVDLDAASWSIPATATTVHVTGTLTAANKQTLLSQGAHVTTWLMQETTDNDELAKDMFTGNTTVTDIILPHRYATAAIPTEGFEGCTSLTSVVSVGGEMVQNDDGTTSRHLTHFSAHSFVPGHLFTSTATRHNAPMLWNDDYNIKAEHIIATGNLNLYDIHKRDNGQSGQASQSDMIGTAIQTLDLGGATLVNDQGQPTNYTFKLDAQMTSVKLPEGMTEIYSDELADKSLIDIQLPASLTTIRDDAFKDCTNLTSVTFAGQKGSTTPALTIGMRAFNKSSLTSINIPARCTSIGGEAFCDVLTLQDVTYDEPSELLTIGDKAFDTCPLKHIDLPSKLQTIGSDAFNGPQNSIIDLIIIPASVTEIKSGAFRNQWIKDIYFLGTECPSIGDAAFSNGSTFGSGNMVNDDVRVLNSNGSYYTDANGNYQNPTQVEINGQKPYNDYISGGYPGDTPNKNALDAMAAAGDKLVGSHDLYSYYDATNPSNTKYTAQLHLNPDLLLAENYDNLCQFTDPSRHYSMIDAYVGESQRWPTMLELKQANSIGHPSWQTFDDGTSGMAMTCQDGTKIKLAKGTQSLHEFSLVSFDAPSGSQKTEWEFPNLKGGLWWTLCVPFNMKKSDVEATFGEGTEVCEFNRVERSHDTTTGTHTLRLCFTHEKCQFDRDGREGDKTNVDDNATVIHAFHPYMIHPTRDNTSAQETAFKFKASKIETGSVIPVNVTATGDGRKYTFIGNMSGTEMYQETVNGVTTQKSRTRRMPQYCYYLAKKTVNNTEVHGLAFNKLTNRTFKPYCAIVIQKQPSEAQDDFQTFFGGAASSAKVSFASPFGWDQDVTTPTGVERVEIVCGADNATAEGIFTLAGQRLTSLPARPGIYVVNGKKTVVR